MSKSTSSYEEKRKQTMAENLKRMAQLNLHTLSLSFKSSLSSRRIKRRYVRKRKISDAPPRRSPRNLFKKTSETNHIQQRAKAVERAKKLELHLGSAFPTFIKPLLQSHLRGCLYMPRTFCKTHLPDDEMMTLIDEDGGQWQLKYHVLYHSLLYGWKKFSIDHQLVAGDVIVFQLIKPTTFKISASNPRCSNIDMALGHFILGIKLNIKTHPSLRHVSVSDISTRIPAT